MEGAIARTLSGVELALIRAEFHERANLFVVDDVRLISAEPAPVVFPEFRILLLPLSIFSVSIPISVPISIIWSTKTHIMLLEWNVRIRR
jgi:hypothetical protein